MTPKIVNVSHEVPEEFIEEGQERKLQKIEKYNEVAVSETNSSAQDDFDFAARNYKKSHSQIK